MPGSDLARLTISWSKETDLALRSYLDGHGMKKGDLSKFIEEAVRWHLFQQTISTIQDRNADSDPDAVMDLIDTTVRDVRRTRAAKRRAAAPPR